MKQRSIILLLLISAITLCGLTSCRLLKRDCGCPSALGGKQR